MIPYHVLSPAGNLTALVTDPVSVEAHAAVASDIMSADTSIEQVGFIIPPSLPGSAFSLQMMGGELCLNAVLAAAFLHMQGTGESQVMLETSGYDEPMTATATAEGIHLTLSSAIITDAVEVEEGWRVDLQGIRLILTHSPHFLDTAHADATFDRHADGKCLATGLIYAVSTPEHVRITPLVRVERTNSIVKESACGSGSIATAFIARAQSGRETFEIRQPSGAILHVSFQGSHELTFAGKVAYLGVRKA